MSKLLACLRTDLPKALIDDLTFGPVPAYMDYFVSERGCTSFILFFRSLTGQYAEERRVEFSRAVWFSPLFLHFMRTVLRPLVSGARAGKQDVQKDVERLVCRWTSYRDLCPMVAIQMLSEVGPAAAARIFSKGCLDVIFGFPLYMFGLCEPFETPPASRAGAIRALFDGGPRPLLPQLITVLCGRGRGSDMVMTRGEDERDCPELFRRFLLSSMDDDMLAAAKNGSVCSIFVGRLGLSYKLPDGVREVPTHLLGDSETLRVKHGTSHLRHLLQRCDLLPEELPEGKDLVGQLYEIFVARGGDEDRLERDRLFRDMTGGPHGIAVSDLAGWLGHIRCERTREVEAVSAFARIDANSCRIQATALLATLPVELAFIASLVEGEWGRIERRGFQWGSRLRPDRVRQDFEHAMDSLKRAWPEACEIEGTRLAQVVFGKLTSQLSFVDFAKSRSDLARLDEPLERRLASEPPSTWLMSLMAEPEKEFHRTRLMEYLREKGVLKHVGRFFAEPSLFRKVALGNRLRAELQAFVRQKGGMRELGADDWQPLEILLWLVAGGRRLLTNYVFIKSFFGAQVGYDEFFQDSSMKLAASIAGAVQVLTGKRPEDMLSAKETALWM